MKSFEEIYYGIKQKFFKKTNIDIARGTVIDTVFYAIADAIKDLHIAIQENKNPYLFTNQKEKELDSTGYFLQCPRLSNETDTNYFYRLQKWAQRNASCNLTAIQEALRTLTYSSSGEYIAFTKGVGTASIYLIPKTYDDNGKDLAIKECKEVLSKIVSPSAYIEYIVPEIIPVKIVAYLDLKEDSDIDSSKQNILKNIEAYINSIAPGDKLMLGELNKIAFKEPGVEYFNVVQLYFNEEEDTTFEILQTLDKKFIFEQIIWWEVEQ